MGYGQHYTSQYRQVALGISGWFHTLRLAPQALGRPHQLGFPARFARTLDASRHAWATGDALFFTSADCKARVCHALTMGLTEDVDQRVHVVSGVIPEDTTANDSFRTSPDVGRIMNVETVLKRPPLQSLHVSPGPVLK
jgi:hypothetical protein